MAEITFEEIMSEVMSLSTLDGVDFFEVGSSTMGQKIYGLHIGPYTGKQILIEAGLHAREYPATLVVVGMAGYLASISTTLDGGVYIIPLANPDGVRIVLNGVDWLNCENWRNYLLSLNNDSLDFSQWKASATSVDLNVNFPALWGEGSQNVFCPAPANFVGFYPASEREVRLLMDFTYRVSPDLTLSYHTKGDVIYYGFETLSTEELSRDLAIANIISSINTYTPIRTENSVGGYSDWVSLELGVPAFTIEVGDPSLPTPIPLSAVEPAIELNKGVPEALLSALNQNPTSITPQVK
ncbi:MAG: hypothetical protein E7354_05240 [Clostridiales bacterium]|nr:hypothetical protein [Clostridiales bacterium]